MKGKYFICIGIYISYRLEDDMAFSKKNQRQHQLSDFPLDKLVGGNFR